MSKTISFGEAIRWCRNKWKIRDSEVARRLGITAYDLSLIEHNEKEISARQCEELAEIFRIGEFAKGPEKADVSKILSVRPKLDKLSYFAKQARTNNLSYGYFVANTTEKQRNEMWKQYLLE